MTAEHDRDPTPPQPSSRDLRRLRVVDAFIDLVLHGDVPPVPSEAAERAGVSRATFFRYFSTHDEFRSEAAARVRERFPELFAIPDIGTGSLDERIERFVDARLQLHETLHPMALLMQARAARDADASDFLDRIRQTVAGQVRLHFDTYLRLHSPERRDDMVTLIAVLTSVESWQRFRHSHGRSPDQTRRAWRHALARILSEP
jgi:AcrR family transcriptional regulator